MNLFFLSCALSFLSLAVPSFADPTAFFNDTEYDAGEHGIFVELDFHSTALKAPQVNFQTWGPECETDKYFFIAPRGMLVGPAGPVILDSRGHMVWHREDFGVAYGLNVQKYHGQDVLTFWSGDDMVVGHGQGYYYMFDNTYQQIKKISAVGENLMADLHEFTVTEQNTALITIYNKTRADMRYWGPEYPADGWVWDCLFQEIDLDTNELLFQWRASDHFTFGDCYHNPRLELDGIEASPFDWFHLNSVDKDPQGNYLLSARYSHALTYVSGSTGEILWNIGGKNSSFYDLSDGLATSFKWQHDARWHNDYTTVTVFDNAAYFVDNTSPARGLHIHVNKQHMTVKLLREWNHPSEYISESQGNLQMLPNGNAFLGYGAAPAFAEFSPDGTLLCDAAFGALHWKESGEFSPGAVMSYRSFKQAWVGRPVEDPRVAFVDGNFYVSWNGDTETRKWSLEGTTDLKKGKWSSIAEFERQGFESEHEVPTATKDELAHLIYRLTAKDRSGAKLGTWLVDSSNSVHRIGGTSSRFRGATAAQVLGIGVVGTLIGLFFARRRAGAAPWISKLNPRRTLADMEKGVVRVRELSLSPRRLATGEVRWSSRDERTSGERTGFFDGRED